MVACGRYLAVLYHGCALDCTSDDSLLRPHVHLLLHLERKDRICLSSRRIFVPEDHIFGLQLPRVKDSYDFTWGEDLSGWLDASSNSSGLIDVIWLLIANVCFLNLMISISGAVFGETAENWESGDMEIKNELVLYCERLYLPFNYWNDEEGQKRQHIVYVEEDHDRPDKEVSD